MSLIFSLAKIQARRRMIVRVTLFSFALIAISLALIAGQREPKGKGKNMSGESSFLTEISENNGLNKLLDASAHSNSILST